MPDAPLHRARARHDGPVGRAACASAAASTTHSGCLRYDRRGYGRSVSHPGPFGIDEQVSDLVGLLGGRRAARVRPQLRRQRRPGDRGSGTRSSSSPSPCTRRRCRGSTGGREPQPVPTRSRHGAIRRMRPNGSYADSSATRDGRSSRRRPVRRDGQRVRRWSASSSICASTRRGCGRHRGAGRRDLRRTRCRPPPGGHRVSRASSPTATWSKSRRPAISVRTRMPRRSPRRSSIWHPG